MEYIGVDKFVTANSNKPLEIILVPGPSFGSGVKVMKTKAKTLTYHYKL